MFIIKRRTKSSNLEVQIKNIYAIALVWRQRAQNNAKISHLKFNLRPHSLLTHGEFILETEFYNYYIDSESAFDLMRFLLKYQITSLDSIVEKTEENLRKQMLDQGGRYLRTSNNKKKYYRQQKKVARH
jgi:hypothetical protein